MTPSPQAADLRSLGARLLELERERTEARDQARLLLALHEAFARIALTHAPDQVIAQMLRTAHDPLGFSRGIFFSTARENGIHARWQVDGSDIVEVSRETADTSSGSALVRALRGEAAQTVGLAGELSAPLVDTRGWYVVSALTHAERTLGVLYVDGHRSRAPRDWETGLVRALTTLAAVSMANSVLFEQTNELATRDPLTALLNRRAFGERLVEALALHAGSGRTVTYAIVDVDDFKAINDAHGHGHGDTVLQLVAATLLRGARTGDLIGRYAGDEFVVLLAHDDAALGRTLVARISADLRAAGLRCSIGAARFPHDADGPSALFGAADRALYATKAAGKNGYSFA